MRVLLVTEASSAGVGRHVIDLSSALVDDGHDVHLVYATGRQDEAFREGCAALAARATARFQSDIVEMRRGPHPSDAKALKALRRIVLEHGPFDVVHGQSSKGGGLARLMRGARGIEDAAIVYTPHCIYTLNPEASGLKRALFGRAELWLARRSDAIIAVSPSEERHLVELGIDASIVHCVPNGIRALRWIDKASARAKLGLDSGSDRVVIGYLARLSKQKNPLLAIEAMARLVKKRGDVVLALAGSGDLEQEGRALADRLGLGNAIAWLGYQRPDLVLPASDLFALSSDYEGMPYVYLEALAAGLPIVTTDVGGAELAIRNRENGIIVARGDVAGFAAALEEVVADAALRKRMGAASKDLAARFDLEHMLRGTLAVYEAARERRLARTASRSAS